MAPNVPLFLQTPRPEQTAPVALQMKAVSNDVGEDMARN